MTPHPQPPLVSYINGHNWELDSEFRATCKYHTTNIISNLIWMFSTCILLFLLLLFANIILYDNMILYDNTNIILLLLLFPSFSYIFKDGWNVFI